MEPPLLPLVPSAMYLVVPPPLLGTLGLIRPMQPVSYPSPVPA